MHRGYVDGIRLYYAVDNNHRFSLGYENIDLLGQTHGRIMQRAWKLLPSTLRRVALVRVLTSATFCRSSPPCFEAAYFPPLFYDHFLTDFHDLQAYANRLLFSILTQHIRG